MDTFHYIYAYERYDEFAFEFSFLILYSDIGFKNCTWFPFFDTFPGLQINCSLIFFINFQRMVCQCCLWLPLSPPAFGRSLHSPLLHGVSSRMWWTWARGRTRTPTSTWCHWMETSQCWSCWTIQKSIKVISYFQKISVANCCNLDIFLLFSYQYGPDTYLLQVKDSDFPARLREYLHVAKQHSAEFQDVKVRIWVCSFLLVTKIFSGKVALIFDENIYQIF